MVDGVLEDPPEEELTPGMSPDLVADAELYRWAGVTLGDDAFFLHRSLQMLSAKEEVKVSYFGKILATKSAGYHIAEALTADSKYDVADEEARLVNFALKPDDEGMRKTEEGGVEFDHEQLDGANK